MSMTSTASLALPSFFIFTHARISRILCFSGNDSILHKDSSTRWSTAPNHSLNIGASRPDAPEQSGPLICGDLTRLRHFPESARSSPSMAARLRFAEIKMLKAVLVNVRQSFVQVVTRELPPEIFVKEVIPLPRTKSPDIFQVHLMHELFDVAVLANRRVYPMSVECIKPLVLVAQGPKVVDIHGHFSLTGIATRMSASSPLAPTAEHREVPHLRCSKRCPSWAGMQMDQAPAPDASCFPPNVISRTAR